MDARFAEIPDRLWRRVAPRLPPEPPKPHGGRPRVPDRTILAGILFVLRTGIPWEYLPRELGCGSGMTCWRRLRDWQRAGVWHRLHQVLLHELGAHDAIAWNRACRDASTVPAKRGASPLARIRRIAANRARSAILFRTPRASHSR